MQAFLLGIFHDYQRIHSDDFLALVADIVAQHSLEYVCEETSSNWTIIPSFVRHELGIEAVNIDMSDAERRAAGIYEALTHRDIIDYASPEAYTAVPYLQDADAVREDSWIDKIEALGVNRVLIMCAFPHPVHFRQRWLQRGHHLLGELAVAPSYVEFDYPLPFKVKQIDLPQPQFQRKFLLIVSDMLILASSARDFESWRNDPYFVPHPISSDSGSSTGN